MTLPCHRPAQVAQTAAHYPLQVIPAAHRQAPLLIRGESVPEKGEAAGGGEAGRTLLHPPTRLLPEVVHLTLHTVADLGPGPDQTLDQEAAVTRRRGRHRILQKGEMTVSLLVTLRRAREKIASAALRPAHSHPRVAIAKDVRLPRGPWTKSTMLAASDAVVRLAQGLLKPAMIESIAGKSDRGEDVLFPPRDPGEVGIYLRSFNRSGLQ